MKKISICFLVTLMVVYAIFEFGWARANENKGEDQNAEALFEEVSKIRDKLKKHEEVSGGFAKDLKQIGISPQLRFGAQPAKSPDEASVLFYFPRNPIPDPNKDGDDWAMVGFTIPTWKNSRVVVRRNWQVIWVGEYAFRMWLAGIDERKLWPPPVEKEKSK